MYPCYVAVKEDLSSLQLVSRTWDELQTCHRDKVSPSTKDSGGCSFPAAIDLCGLGHLSDALVCRKNWDNPLVTRDGDLMLGVDTLEHPEKVSLHELEVFSSSLLFLFPLWSTMAVRRYLSSTPVNGCLSLRRKPKDTRRISGAGLTDIHVI